MENKNITIIDIKFTKLNKNGNRIYYTRFYKVENNISYNLTVDNYKPDKKGLYKLFDADLMAIKEKLHNFIVLN